ncbi:MAG: hypothetical protein PHE92_09255, partial [Candidatus Cloacimonetes bacterium]|nr:hypothetical protein [Candidatus Cloacimonadota bacterium]
MAQIDREVFLKVYRSSQENMFINTINRKDKQEQINEWVKSEGKTPFVGEKNFGFEYNPDKK